MAWHGMPWMYECVCCVCLHTLRQTIVSRGRKRERALLGHGGPPTFCACVHVALWHCGGTHMGHLAIGMDMDTCEWAAPKLRQAGRPAGNRRQPKAADYV